MDKTDATLKALEKQIKATYTKAYQEMKKEMTDIMSKIEINPEMSLAQKMALMTKYDRLNTLSTQLANTAYNANITAQKMINNEMVNIYDINYNGDAERLGFGLIDHTAIKKVLKQEENPFNMISSLRDKEGIRNQMKGQLLSGLLKGESMQKIARRLKDVSEKSLKDCIRIARTETTRVQNSAKMDIGKEGQRLGFEMWKRWVATTDGRVREDHLAMNGVEVPQDEPFVLPDGSKMMFPGDISMGADASQVINCRCTVIEFQKPIADDVNTDVIRDEVKIAQGKDILYSFERREDKFEFEIEDAMNQQGFDGKPRVVSQEEFDKAVQESGFVAQRTYSADSQEVLDVYRDELYNGKWYVDCSNGGAQYGQGMYCAADYNGQITDGIKAEMHHYQELNKTRGNSLFYTETLTLDKDAKIVTYDDIVEQFAEYRIKAKDNAMISYIDSISDRSDDFIVALKGQLGVGNIGFDEAFGAYGKLTQEEKGLMSDYLSKARNSATQAELNATSMNIGSFATLRGYDAINASGHGESGSYTVILNRTKVIFLNPNGK